MNVKQMQYKDLAFKAGYVSCRNEVIVNMNTDFRIEWVEINLEIFDIVIWSSPPLKLTSKQIHNLHFGYSF